MKYRLVLVLFAMAVFAASPAHADFTKVNVQRVPLLRLILNQTKAINEDPGDAHGYYALGRLYAMAYAQRSDTIPAIKRIGEDDYIPYYGYEKRLPHFFIPKPAPKDTSKYGFTSECLSRAVECFKNALTLDTSYVPAYIGLAWCQQQSGKKNEAIMSYRVALAKSEAQLDKNGVVSIETAEISSYLVSLLDKEKNKQELDMLAKYVEGFTPNYLISPILVPMEESLSFESLVDTTAQVSFNLDGLNNGTQWQWITPKAAWLVYLNDDKDAVTSGMQFFGSISYNINWDNGYKALALLDDNRDGVLSGTELRHLALWNDKNGDGISSADEIRSFEKLGVETLSLDFSKKNDRLYLNTQGLKLKSGKILPTYDWFPRGTAGKA